MIKFLISTALLTLCLNSVFCQHILDPMLKEMEDKKEIKTFSKSGFLKLHEFFDKNGNLIFSKFYNEEAEVLSILYQEFTEEDRLKMRISVNTVSGFQLDYFDQSFKGLETFYSAINRQRNPYDPRTKKFLQKATSIEDLLNQRQIKKLIKRKNYESEREIYRDAQGRIIKEICIGENNDTLNEISNKYDEFNNVTMFTFRGNIFKNEKKTTSRSIYTYDDNGNRIKTTWFRLSPNKEGKEEWLATGYTQTKYNDQNQKTEELNYIDNLDGSVKKTTWIYDEKNRITNIIKYAENGEKQFEYKYEYLNDGFLHKQSIDIEKSINDPDYNPKLEVFQIVFYKND